jgi:hypothetical protein
MQALKRSANAEYLALCVRVSANSGSPPAESVDSGEYSSPIANAVQIRVSFHPRWVMRGRLQGKANPRDSDEPSL